MGRTSDTAVRFVVVLFAVSIQLACSLGQTSPQPEPNVPQSDHETSLERDKKDVKSDMTEPFNPKTYEASLQSIAKTREKLAAEYRAAKTDNAKATIRAKARRVVVDAIVETIFPAWQGTPWGLGRNSTATRPHQAKMVVGCSYFVTSVLENVGLQLSSRYTFAQAAALHIQRSLAPAKKDLHRFLSIPPSQLRERLLKLDEGLYIIGLNNHVGFVVVRDGDVRFVHASYTDDKVVIDEPLLNAKAIANSQKAGYFVSSLFQDERLVEHWLEGRSVPFKKLGM